MGSLSGVVLLICTAIALAWANSPWGESYFHLWEMRISLGPAADPLTLSLHHWINDGLMVVFFLLVGLEIKRELLVGELASIRQAALPIMAALGGMIVPALIYTAFNVGTEAIRGWGIPMATDIAFALGILALLGPRVPIGLKVFLAALAIVDDLGAVLVIAVFYTASIDAAALLGAVVCLAILVGLNRARVTALTPYVLIGFILWIFFLRSGIHSTIAGVLLAMCIPSNTRINAMQFSERARSLIEEFDRSETGDLLVITSRGQQEALHALDVATDEVSSPLLRLEHRLHRTVAFVIMPLFALANAGVSLTGAGAVLASPVAQGVGAGLVFGKTIGIAVFAWLAVRMGIAALPAGVDWRSLFGVAWLGGIGFTMSLFIAGLAFESALLDAAKLAILAASAVAGVIGYLLLRTSLPMAGSTTEEPAEPRAAGTPESATVA